MSEPPQYAERMFPAPVDPGVARPDRAVSTVVSGVDTAIKHVEEGQQLAGKLDASAQNAAARAHDALKTVAR